jgi:hypothetical protein
LGQITYPENVLIIDIYNALSIEYNKYEIIYYVLQGIKYKKNQSIIYAIENKKYVDATELIITKELLIKNFILSWFDI